MIGKRLGPYEVVAKLGEGGMGEVWRARDTRLKRDVAIKILPEAFATDPERLARFQREAEVLAALNHPHIAAIYGLEESAGTRALVMELVEGETLADRIARGPIPVDEVLPVARQITDALEAAHEQGIIHRDLKPANIKVRPDGTVKVLDFGLAKLSDAAGSAQPAAGSPHASMSPTITSPAIPGTMVGTILGTAAYMSPEQARGKPADKRSDIWAFGCVLFEMLTGTPPFDGEDIAVVLASVIKGEPDWTTLSPGVPAALRRLLRRCLEKDVSRRLQAIGEARITIADLMSGAREEAPVAAPAPVVTRREFWHRTIPIAAALIVVALLAGGGVWQATRPSTPPVIWTTLATSGASALVLQGTDRDIAITPDGSRIVYRGDGRLLVRALDQLEPTVLTGLGSTTRGVFISPDGQWIGLFGDGDSLKKVSITGGSPVTIAGTGGGGSRGATWSPDGSIVFSVNLSGGAGLLRVSESGGTPIVLTKPDRARGEGDHRWPEFLPGGQAVLFTITPASGPIENAQIAVLDLKTGTSKTLVRGGSHAHYLPTGHLVYGFNGTLRAVPFDLARLEVTGTPRPVLEKIFTTAGGAVDAMVAASGTLVYVTSGAGGGGQRVVMSVDRQGRSTTLPTLPPDSYRDVRVSPDGSKLALATLTDVWTYDFSRATPTRLTTDSASDTAPLWSPDGRRIIFKSTRDGYPVLYSRAADGAGSDERFFARANTLIDLRGVDWSRDGRQLLFDEVPPNAHCSIGQMSVEQPAQVKALVTNDSCNQKAAVSPDGRWMAYESFLSGRPEIYVERYPELGSRQQISTGGGHLPVWSRDGRELFFSGADDRQMFVVTLRSGTTLEVGRPQRLFEFPMAPNGGGPRPYDLTPDGRFIIIQGDQALGGGAAPGLVLVQNWTEELKRLVPLK